MTDLSTINHQDFEKQKSTIKRRILERIEDAMNKDQEYQQDDYKDVLSMSIRLQNSSSSLLKIVQAFNNRQVQSAEVISSALQKQQRNLK
jgi:hypothetical protein